MGEERRERGREGGGGERRREGEGWGSMVENLVSYRPSFKKVYLSAV